MSSKTTAPLPPPAADLDRIKALAVETWEIDRVKPYPGNPRLNDDAVERVAESIRTFGFKIPILVTGEGIIIAGHTRLKAARKLGLTHVPVIQAADLSEDEARALRLADNKLSEIADWDFEMLGVELSALGELDWDLASLGFSDQELTQLLGDTSGTEGMTDGDAVPDVDESEPPVSERGVLYALGDHRLLCGDATSASDMKTLMEGTHADMLLTDPPYNVGYVGKTKDALTIENDSMDGDAYRAFLASAFRVADSAMRPGAVFYIWHADSEGFNTRSAAQDAGWRTRQCLVWNKNWMVIGRQDYHWRHEPCLYGWRDGASHKWYGDRTQTTVLNFDRPSRSEEHPTMKPVALFAYLMGNSSAPGETILDPFGGSGTTIIAAETHGRKARVMELAPRYCDVIRQRYAEFVYGTGCAWQARTPEVHSE